MQMLPTPATSLSSHNRPALSASARQRPVTAGENVFENFHRAQIARIQADLAAVALEVDLTSEDRIVAEQAWDEANLEQSAAAFAQGVEWAAQLTELSRRGLILRDDLPAQLVIDRQQLEHDRELADRDALIAWQQSTIATLTAENRDLRETSSAVGAALRNTKLSAPDRIIHIVAVMEFGSRQSRGLATDPWRPVIDAPAHRETPEDGERVGLASELGLHRNTVGKAIDAWSDADDAPLLKTTVDEHDDRGRFLRKRIELRPNPACETTIPGMLWRLARFDPQRPKPEPPEPLVCQSHPEAKIRVRTVRTAVCTADGEVIDERATTTTAPRPAPMHMQSASVNNTPHVGSLSCTSKVHRSGGAGDDHRRGREAVAAYRAGSNGTAGAEGGSSPGDAGQTRRVMGPARRAAAIRQVGGDLEAAAQRLNGLTESCEVCGDELVDQDVGWPACSACRVAVTAGTA
jgi:hypothetical protein